MDSGTDSERDGALAWSHRGAGLGGRGSRSHRTSGDPPGVGEGHLQSGETKYVMISAPYTIVRVAVQV